MGKVSMAGVRHGWARPSGMLEVAGGGAVRPRLGGRQAADSGVANTRAWLVVALAGRQAGDQQRSVPGHGTRTYFFFIWTPDTGGGRVDLCIMIRAGLAPMI